MSHTGHLYESIWFMGGPRLDGGAETKLSLQVVHHASVTDPQENPRTP